MGVEYEHLQEFTAAVDAYTKGLKICSKQIVEGPDQQPPPIALTLKQNIEEIEKKLKDRE